MSNEELFYNDEDADPVVSEMPVYSNNMSGDSLVVVQFPTRKPGEDATTNRISLKPKAQLLEMSRDSNLPMQFVDSSNGAGCLTQKYNGVLNPANSRFAVGKVKDNALYLSLVSRTGQLRPSFPEKTQLLNPSMLQSNKAPTEATNLRSVQMSVKSTSQEVPKHSVALEFWRQAEKEETVPLQVGELTDGQKNELFTGNIVDTAVETQQWLHS